MVHYLLRPRYFEKLVFWILLSLFCLIFLYRGFQIRESGKLGIRARNISNRITTKAPEVLRQILIWTTDEPLHVFRKKGQSVFYENNCKFRNCYTTYMKKSITNLTPYDAIVFSVESLGASRAKIDLPTTRTPEQRYIFASTRSASIADPITLPQLDNHFNWTWTYRLDSDILWRHFTIHDYRGRKIGPKIGTKWLKSFKPTGAKVRRELWLKRKAAAWLVYSCKSPAERSIETYVFDLQRELDEHNFTVDIFGPCRKDCGTLKHCAEIFRKDYYFYLAFENSFDADYVSYGLLNAVNNYALPIVMGGADYSRFLPPGSYLDATKMNATTMAATMLKLMSNFTLYQDYFRWTNHYTYRNSLNSEVCNLCEALNDPKMMKEIKTHRSFRKWWWTGTETRRTLYDLINKMYMRSMLQNVEITYNKLVHDTFKIEKDADKIVQDTIGSDPNQIVQDSLYMY